MCGTTIKPLYKPASFTFTFLQHLSPQCPRYDCGSQSYSRVIIDVIVCMLKAFSNMTQSVRRALCSVMLYSTVDLAGSVVLSDEDELANWSVVLNGHLQVLLPDGTIQHLHMGDRYGLPVVCDRFYRATRMRSADYAVARCLSVCPSHTGIESKRLYISSKFFHHRVTPSF